MKRRSFVKMLGALFVAPRSLFGRPKPHELVLEKLGSPDPAVVQDAIAAVNDFTRVRMREEGFFRRILPLAQPITPCDIRRDTPVFKLTELRQKLYD